MTSSLSDGVVGGLVCEWTIGWVIQIVCTIVYIAKLRTVKQLTTNQRLGREFQTGVTYT